VTAPAGAAPGPRDVIERVEGELRAFWSTPPAPGETPKARACTMNLVVVAASPALAAPCVPVVDEVIRGTPARALVVGLDVDGADALEAESAAVCTPGAGGGPAVCSERITLTARGDVCARVASCVAALCATDVPTTLVWLGRVHAGDPAFEPLARDAARIVLDARRGSIASLAGVVYWARARAEGDRPGIADLAWTRLAPWQELCARMFDEPALRGLSQRVTRVTLRQAGTPGAPLGSAGVLLLGWLATRLGWKAGSLAGKLRLTRGDGDVRVVLRAERRDGEAPGSLLGVTVEAEGAGPTAGTTLLGELARDSTDGDGALCTLTVTRPGAAPQRIDQSVRLRAGGPEATARLLELTLHRRTHDAALAEAAAWADELRDEELACG